MEDKKKLSLFDMDELQAWKKEWKDMPEFIQKDLTPIKSIVVHFESLEMMREFAELIKQKITPKTQSLWFPEAEIGRYANKRFIDDES